MFDEIEKAHPDVFNVLLQILDDGRLTDGQGRVVDFKNTIIILTSNLGSEYILEDITPEGEISERAKFKVDTLLHSTFRPEFLNRLDETVLYKPLTKRDISAITDLMLADLNKRLAQKQYKCVVTTAAKEIIIDNGYDPNYGARPLRRYIQKEVETLLSKKIIADDPVPDTTMIVDAKNNQLYIRS